MNIDEKYIAYCLTLAKSGLGTTYPNPLVGSVVVFNDTILGSGFHQRAGNKHAEVLAIESVADQSLLAKATLYVNLEPCSHYGKTPPCADLIIAKGIRRVVIGTLDSNKIVRGNGLKKLMNAGVSVTYNVQVEGCRVLNKRFFTYHEKQRPYIILKYAQTQDSFIDILRDDPYSREPFVITNTYSKILTHRWRSENQAILVGTTTAINDNPQLNVRDWYGPSPTRVVLDRSLKIPRDYKVWDDSMPTLFISEQQQASYKQNTRIERINFSKNISQQLCEVLYKNGIQSVIVEGGASLLKQFIEADLWDEARVFTAKKAIGKGLPAPKLNTDAAFEVDVYGDSLKYYRHKANNVYLREK